MERLFFELIAPELPQISSTAALAESGQQEKRSKSGLTIGKSCEVYPKVGGRSDYFHYSGTTFSSDQWIRDAVRGYKIEIQFNANDLIKCLSLERKECFSVEVGKLLRKEAKRRASLDPKQFLSNQFTIPKKGDELRPVINLKPLNHFVEYHHFKVEGLSSFSVLINPNDYMITTELKDAFLSVPIHADHSKYLLF